MGNPETDDFYDSRGLLEYAWSHAVISNQVYDQASIACDFKHLDWPVDCQKAMNLVFKEYKKIDIYNIYAPTCLKNKTSALAEDLVEKVITYYIHAYAFTISFGFLVRYIKTPSYVTVK